MQVIHDKVTIPRQDPRISRPRLLGVLGGGIDSCASTIITGRAGSGKTLLAKDFARSCGPRTTWYTVEAADGELPIFFRYLIESVSRQRPGFGVQLLANFAGSLGYEDIPTLAEAFLYELQECRGEPLLMVVDDLHLIYDAGWVAPFFGRLLPLLPPEAHMLLIGRSLPPTPVWRMRSKQTLCLIEESTLAFTPHEAAELFASYGLADLDARAAVEQSQGRAAALDELARRMNGHDARGDRLCGCGGYQVGRSSSILASSRSPTRPLTINVVEEGCGSRIDYLSGRHHAGWRTAAHASHGDADLPPC